MLGCTLTQAAGKSGDGGVDLYGDLPSASGIRFIVQVGASEGQAAQRAAAVERERERGRERGRKRERETDSPSPF